MWGAGATCCCEEDLVVFDVVEDGGDVVVKTAFFAVGVCDLEEEDGG